MSEPRTDADKLRVLATWFDHFDDWREATGKIAPGISEYRDVQKDLRRIAHRIEAEARSEGLDAAWAKAEAALPEGGWRLRLTRSDEDFDIWQASAVSPAFFDGENDNDAECVIGEAVVPSWALLALVAALSQHKEPNRD